MKTLMISVIVGTVCGAVPVFAAGNEYHSRNTKSPDRWLAPEQVAANLNQRGYHVRRLKVDDGCLEADVTDQNGDHRELYVDPITGLPGCGGRFGEHDD